MDRVSKEGMLEIQLSLTSLNMFISDAIKEAGKAQFDNFEVFLIQERLAGVMKTLREIRENITEVDGSITLNNKPITIVSGEIVEG